MKTLIIILFTFGFAFADTFFSEDSVTFDFSEQGSIVIDSVKYDASADIYNKFIKGKTILDVNILAFSEIYKELTMLVEGPVSYYAVYMLNGDNKRFTPLDYIKIDRANVIKIAFIEDDYVWVLRKPVYGPEYGGKITGYLLTQYMAQKKEHTYGTIVDRVLRKHEPVFITDSADDFGKSPDQKKIFIRFGNHYRWVVLKTPREGISLIGKDVEKDGYDRRKYFYQLLETTPPDQEEQ